MERLQNSPGKKRHSFAGLFSRNSIWSNLSLVSSPKLQSVFSRHQTSDNETSKSEAIFPIKQPANDSQDAVDSKLSSSFHILPQRPIKKLSAPTFEDFADTSDEDSQGSKTNEYDVNATLDPSGLLNQAGTSSMHRGEIGVENLLLQQAKCNELHEYQNQYANSLKQQPTTDKNLQPLIQYEPYDSDSVLENYFNLPRSSQDKSTFVEEFDETKSSTDGNNSSFQKSIQLINSNSPPPIPISNVRFSTTHSLSTSSSGGGSPSLHSSSSPSFKSVIEGEDPAPFRRRPLSPQYRSFQIPSIMEEDHPTPNSSMGSIQLSPARDPFNHHNTTISSSASIKNPPTKVISGGAENRLSINYEGMEQATIVRTHSLTHARSVRQKPNLVSILRHPSTGGGSSPGHRDSNASGSMDNSQSTTGDDISMSTGELLSQLNDVMGAVESETLFRGGIYDRKSQGYGGLRSSIISHPSRAYHISSDLTGDLFQKKGFDVPTPPSRGPSGTSSGSGYSINKANVTLPMTNAEILKEYEHQDYSLAFTGQLPPFTKEHSSSSSNNNINVTGTSTKIGRTRMPIPPPIIPNTVLADRLRKQNSHEDMIPQQHHDDSTTSYHDNFSDDLNDDLQDTIDASSSSNGIFDEKRIYDQSRYFNFYPWWYFGLLMVLGLFVPPVYFLITCGVFDVNNKFQQFRLNYYFQQYSRHNRELPRRVKFTRTQKWISFLFGLFWISVIVSMIGTGLGLALTRG